MKRDEDKKKIELDLLKQNDSSSIEHKPIDRSKDIVLKDESMDLELTKANNLQEDNGPSSYSPNKMMTLKINVNGRGGPVKKIRRLDGEETKNSSSDMDEEDDEDFEGEETGQDA